MSAAAPIGWGTDKTGSEQRTTSEKPTSPSDLRHGANGRPPWATTSSGLVEKLSVHGASYAHHQLGLCCVSMDVTVDAHETVYLGIGKSPLNEVQRDESLQGMDSTTARAHETIQRV